MVGRRRLATVAVVLAMAAAATGQIEDTEGGLRVDVLPAGAGQDCHGGYLGAGETLTLDPG